MITASIPHINFKINKSLRIIEKSINSFNDALKSPIGTIHISFSPNDNIIGVELCYTGENETPQECASKILNFVESQNWNTFLGRGLEGFQPENVPNDILDILPPEVSQKLMCKQPKCEASILITYSITAQALRMTHKYFRDELRANIKAVKNYCAVEISGNLFIPYKIKYNFQTKELSGIPLPQMVLHSPSELLLNDFSSYINYSGAGSYISILGSIPTNRHTQTRSYTYSDEEISHTINYHVIISITVEHNGKLHRLSANLLNPIIKQSEYTSILLADIDLSDAMYSHASVTDLKRTIRGSMLRGVAIDSIHTTPIKRKLRLAEYSRFNEVIMFAELKGLGEAVMFSIKRRGENISITPLNNIVLSEYTLNTYTKRINNLMGDLFTCDREFAKHLLVNLEGIHSQDKLKIYFI